MNQKILDKAEKLFRSKYEDLTELERHVAHHIMERTPISTNIVQDYSEQLTFGQKMADKVASFGGSWIFISIFVDNIPDRHWIADLFHCSSPESEGPVVNTE